MPNQPPVLAYDDSLKPDSVSIREEPDFLRITTPPVYKPRNLSLVFLLMLFVLFLGVWMVITALRNPAIDRIETIPSFLAITTALSTLTIFLIIKLRTRFVFEVSPIELTIRRVRGRRVAALAQLRRDRVRPVTVEMGSTNLLVAVTGAEFRTYHVTNDRATAERIVERINAALISLPTARQIGHSELMPAQEQTATARREQFFRLVCIAISIWLTGCVIGFFFGETAGSIICVGLTFFITFMVVVISGITMGTQDKEYWQ